MMPLPALNDAVDGTKEPDIVGKLLRPVGCRRQQRPDDAVLVLHQLLAVEILMQDEKDQSYMKVSFDTQQCTQNLMQVHFADNSPLPRRG